MEAPLCRWVAESVILDVLPIDPKILGFGNKWYASAMTNALNVQLPSNRSIRMVSGPYFLITKLEAFDGRGKGDYLLSHDIEDIIAVLDGRPQIVDEVKQAEPELKQDLAGRFQKLLQDVRFNDAVSGHMLTDEISQRRTSIILNRIKEIAENK